MNKLIYIFAGLFLCLVCLVATSDPPAVPTVTEPVTMQDSQEPTEETIPIETTAPETVPTEPPDLFLAASSSDSPNNEMQIYLPQQVEIDGRSISITAERLGNSWQEYLSGKVESIEAVRYGTFAFEVNTIRGTGLFPAIWMLPTNGSPLPEVDIYEHVGNKPNEFWCVRHYQDDKLKKEDHYRRQFPVNNVPETYIVKFEWTPEKMTWYLNEEEIFSLDENIPDIPMYLIINLAVGGNWPGMPNVTTGFPAVFHVEVLEYEPVETFPRS